MQLRTLPSILLLFITTSCGIGEVDGVFRGDSGGDVIILEGDALANELATSPVHQASAPFVRLGIVWDADRPEAIEYSASADGATWSSWRAAEVHHIEVERDASFVGQLSLGLEPQRFFRIRGGSGVATYARIELLSDHVDDSVEDSDQSLTGPGRSLTGVAINDRASWGARATRCTSRLGDAYRMAIHHTETPTNDSLSPQARLRQIQSYHMDVRGWCDIGYHFLMSRDGRLWEGRPSHLLGAHAGGSNTGNVGISVMGSHDSVPITSEQLSSLSTLVRAVSDEHAIELNRTRIKGHREYKATTCPGNALFAQLGEIVELAANEPNSGTDGDGDGDDGIDDGGDCGAPLETDGPWSCSGLTGTTTNPDDNYYTTSFGCWVDENGVPRSDAGDNCIPACSLSSIGCDGLSGPECERSINWFAAGSDRWGCGTLLRVTNPDNGKAAVLKVIDRGPNCTIENRVDHWVVDMSYRASHYLFGGPTSATERADVDVEVMPPGTPVGPSFGDFCEDPQSQGVTVLGVLYAGSDTSDRIVGATVTLAGQTVTTDSAGFWQFSGVPEGSFSVTASAAGYETRTITGATYAAESWSSFGLSPAASPTGTAILQGVIYRTSDSSNRIANATVTLSTGHSTTASASGYYKLTDLPAGPVTITASAPGYPTNSVTRTLVDGQGEWGSVRLE